jgi:hypothetical protein
VKCKAIIGTPAAVANARAALARSSSCLPRLFDEPQRSPTTVTGHVVVGTPTSSCSSGTSRDTGPGSTRRACGRTGVPRCRAVSSHRSTRQPGPHRGDSARRVQHRAAQGREPVAVATAGCSLAQWATTVERRCRRHSSVHSASSASNGRNEPGLVGAGWAIGAVLSVGDGADGAIPGPGQRPGLLPGLRPGLRFLAGIRPGTARINWESDRDRRAERRAVPVCVPVPANRAGSDGTTPPSDPADPGGMATVPVPVGRSTFAAGGPGPSRRPVPVDVPGCWSRRPGRSSQPGRRSRPSRRPGRSSLSLVPAARLRCRSPSPLPSSDETNP